MQNSVQTTTQAGKGAVITFLEDGSLIKRYEVSLEGQSLEDAVARLLKSKSEGMKIPGFRPGRAPMDRVFAQYGMEALEKGVAQRVQRVVDDLMAEHKWPLLMAPQYEVVSLPTLNSLQDLSSAVILVSLKFFLRPTLPEVDFSTLSVTQYDVDISDELIQKTMEERAAATMTSEPLANPREAQLGDTLVYTLEYVGDAGLIKSVEGAFQLGRGVFPKEFQDTLVGISHGHRLEERIRVPKNFPDAELAGKKLTFTIVFSEIRHTVPHKLDDAFLDSLGLKSMEEYRQQLMTLFTQEAQTRSHNAQLAELNQKLRAVLDFDMPDVLVQENFQDLWKKVEEEIHAHQNQHPSSSREEAFATKTKTSEEEVRKQIWNGALQSARYQFFLDHLVKTHNFKLLEAEMGAVLDQIAERQNMHPTQLSAFFQKNPQRLRELQRNLLRFKAESWMLEKCAKEHQKISLEALRTKTSASGAMDPTEEFLGELEHSHAESEGCTDPSHNH